MEEFIRTHRAKCPHCLGELEKRYGELGDWYYVCVDCKKTVPLTEIHYMPIEEHFARAENNHIRKTTLNKLTAKDTKEEQTVIARCRRCGRKLTTPKSIERGLGPVCYKKIADELWEPVIQDEEPEPTGAGHSREQDAIDKILHKMR